jgi:hypothetical protein
VSESTLFKSDQKPDLYISTLVFSGILFTFLYSPNLET